MDAVNEREIIRLWNLLRLLEREGWPTIAVRRQIEKALEHAAWAAIERLRAQVHRQRGEIRQLESRGSRRLRPKPSWKECSTRSTICVPNGID
jgi:hypothetical protein